jgi:NADH dehydrogenase [ubiquinone] 1 alpha subcomplex assembly factor 1
MPRLIFDFTDPHASETWQAIDDRVMGGVSRSRLRHVPAGHAVFEGEVSLERNGGFASVRSAPGALGVPGAQACVIELCGDPRQFKLSLVTDAALDSVSHQCGFSPSGRDWQIMRLPLDAFRASFRGREASGAPPLDPGRIRQVGLLIGARQAGPFELHIRQIRLD